jgi:hypothetical protein
MHSLTHFHEAQRGYGCGTYGDVGDRSNDYVVTKDGEVYYWRYFLFGLSSSRVYVLKYSAVSKDETNWVTAPVFEGEQAEAITAKIVGSWNDYGTAKQYADRVVADARKGKTTPPPSPIAPGGAPPPDQKRGVGGLVAAAGILVAAGGLGFVIYKLRASGQEK